MKPIQKRIFQALVKDISSGIYPPDSLLPTEEQLCVKFGASRYHIHAAIKELEMLDLTTSNKKGGTRLKRLPSTYELQCLQKLFTHKVCVLNSCSPSFRHISWNERIFNALSSTFSRAGVELEVRLRDSMCDDLKSYAAEIASIARSGVSAIILIPENSIHYHEIPEMLFHSHDSIFVFERGSMPYDSSIYNIVAINNFADGVSAAECAIRQGAKRLIFTLTDSMESSWRTARYNGAAMGAFRMTGGGIRVEYFVRGIHGDFPLQSSSPDTAIIACHDEAAALLIERGCAHHLQPMRDYKIIGFGDDSRFKQFQLTTLSPQLELIGTTLAERILSSLETVAPAERTCHQIASRLIRRSTM